MTADEQNDRLDCDQPNDLPHNPNPSSVVFTNHARLRNDQRFSGSMQSQSIAKQISRAGSDEKTGATFHVRIGVASYVCIRTESGIVVKTIMYARSRRFKQGCKPVSRDEDWRDVNKRHKKKRRDAEAERRRRLRRARRKTKEGD